MLDGSDKQISILIDAEKLFSKTFTFKVEPQGSIISEDFVFHKNGFLIGYSHPNEMYWEIEGDFLNILDQNGRITCQFSTLSGTDGLVRFGGYFRDPSADYRQTDSFHVLEENDSDSCTKIQSFDLFDTLVARRCYDPLEIFRIVERKSGIVGFADIRHRTEMSIFGHHVYGVDEIYGIMVSHKFLTEKQATVLKYMELEEEWEHLFPIAEVVARVGENDIIISDMYLPRPFIERVLKEKCGLDNKLYLSNYGKHHRQIWPEILNQYNLRRHFGDNIQADVISPSAFGIPATVVNISKWDETERIFHAIGLGQYAHVIRETRLNCFHNNVAIHHSLKAQASINIPLMVLGTFWLRHCTEQYKADKLLLAARDCNLWHEMVSSRHFAVSGMPISEYIRISRSVCYIESTEYEAYLQSKFGQKTLLVDFVGTGKSLGTIIDRMNRQDAVKSCILIGEPRSAEILDRPPETLLLKDFHRYRVFFEALNASLDGATVLTIFDNYQLKIMLQQNEFSGLVRMIVSEMRKTFQHFMCGLDQTTLPQNIPSIEVLRTAANAIVELAPAWSARLTGLASEQKQNLDPGNPLNAFVAA